MMINRSAINKIRSRYNAEHDLGPDAPVHWSVNELMELVDTLTDHIEKLEERMTELEESEGDTSIPTTVERNANARRYQK